MAHRDSTEIDGTHVQEGQTKGEEGVFCIS